MLRLRRATALGLAAACAGGLALAGAIGVPAASAVPLAPKTPSTPLAPKTSKSPLASRALFALGAPLTPAALADSVRDGQDWALNMMNVPQAWDQGSQGQGTTVAVLDSGVNREVSDLDGSVVTGPDYTGVDTPSSNPDWGQHGTWMASIIAGHGHGFDDDDGIMGVAPKARILSVRVIPDRNDPEYSKYEGEQEADVQDSLAKGITYAVNHGANVISMSIGYSAPSASVRSALQYAYGHGVAVIASSGNSGDTSSASKDGYAPLKFPADYPGVIGVAAVSSAGQVAGFSSNNLSVEVAAPGVNISAQGRDGQYWLVTGTSPACALVAGVAALIKSRYPGLAPDLLAKALSSTTHYRPAGGYDQNVGFGTIDASAALTEAGQLAHQRAASTGTAASHNFGGGPTAVAADPVAPRGSGQLILFAVLALTALALVAAAVSRLAVLNQLRRREHAELGAGSVPVANASFGRPPPPNPAQSEWAHSAPAQPISAHPGSNHPGQPEPRQYAQQPKSGHYGQQPESGQPEPGQYSQAESGWPRPERAQPGPAQLAQAAPGWPQPTADQPSPAHPASEMPGAHQPLPSRTPQSSGSRPAPESRESRPSRPSRTRPAPEAREPLPSRSPESRSAAQFREYLPTRTSPEPRPRPSFQPHELPPSRTPRSPEPVQAPESQEPREFRPAQTPRTRPSFHPHEPQPSSTPDSSQPSEPRSGPESREPLPARRSPQSQQESESREASSPQAPSDAQATRPLRIRRESQESREPEEPRDSEGHRAPSGWWHPSDVDE